MSEPPIPYVNEVSARRSSPFSAAGLQLPAGLGHPSSTLPTPGLRTGPSRRMTEAVLQRALAAVDTRLVAQLGQMPAGAGPAAHKPLPGDARLELAWLLRADRMLRHQLSSLSDDVVLCDSQAELADGVQAALVDLGGELAQRSGRLLSFLRELLSELAALHSAQVGDLKLRLQRLRQALDQQNRGALGPPRGLPQLMLHAAKLHYDLCLEMERLAPRPPQALLDQVARTIY
jgi:hypothetical protein